MVKNVTVNFSEKNGGISKIFVHKIVTLLKNELNLNILSLPINFISAAEIAKINKKYLNHNYSTDVISFNYTGNTADLDGEIFISTDDTIYNSKKYGVTFVEEIIRLIIHGILHLIGYNDKSESERRKMQLIEDKLFHKYLEIYRGT